MSKNWFPIIDEDKCVSCGNCINNCKNEVYDNDSYPTPKVINPDNCCEGCHGCQVQCPVQAISYFGEEKESF